MKLSPNAFDLLNPVPEHMHSPLRGLLKAEVTNGQSRHPRKASIEVNSHLTRAPISVQVSIPIQHTANQLVKRKVISRRKASHRQRYYPFSAIPKAEDRTVWKCHPHTVIGKVLAITKA